MKHLLIAATALAATASMTSAGQLSVRSGDHADFSRLTLPIASDQKWTARRTQSGIEVTLAEHVDGFDTQTVFARMPRNRIGALSTTSDTLKLRIDCACEATAFVESGLLVIDVANPGTPLAAAAILARTDFPAPRRVLPRPKQTADPLPWIGSGAPLISTGSASNPSNIVPNRSGLNNQSQNLDTRAEILREMQLSLSEGVASAASVGLLENSYDAPRPRLPAPIAVNTAYDAEPQEFDMPFTGQSRNLRITSSMDLPPDSTATQRHAAASGVSCPSDDFLPIDTWGGSGFFAVEVGRARDALFDARDHLDLKAALALAKVYLYFGFGAEALDALSLDDTLAKKHSGLVAIATIMERGHMGVTNPLGVYSDCSSDIALWATLGYRELPEGKIIDTKAVLRAVNKLPGHLRHFLVPALSDRLLEYGDSAAAAMAMRSIERLPESLSPKGALAKANLAVQNGSPAAAMLEQVIDTNSEQSPEALVTLVNAKLSADEPLATATADLVEAYAQELRGTEIGKELRRTQVIALGQSAQFEAAFAALDELSPSLSPEDGRQIRQNLLERLSIHGDDFTFLNQMFQQDSGGLAQMTSPAKLHMAQRLMTLGFAAQVQELLVSVPDRPRSTQRQLLAAQAALMLQQPFQAQAALIGMEGPQVAKLMAQAKEMTGAFSEAAALFVESGAPEDATRAAWLSDDWQNLITADTPGFGAITQVAAQAPVLPSDNTGPLGLAGAALEESQTTRSMLSALLSDPLLAVRSSQEHQDQ